MGLIFPLEFQLINEDMTGIMANISGFLDYVISGSIDNQGLLNQPIEFTAPEDRIDAEFQFNFSYI